MSLNDQIFELLTAKGVDACRDYLETHPAGRDSDERRVLAQWRSSLLDREGRHADALDALNAAATDFPCRSSLAMQKAQLIAKLGRIGDAISVLRAAPIAQEVARYPGLAWEAAYLGCHFYRKQGETPPPDWFGLIPEDFETRIDGQVVGKSSLR